MTHQSLILDFCSSAFEHVLAFNHTLFALAKWAFILAFALAVISTGIDLWAKVEAAKADGAGEGITAKGFPAVTPDIAKVLKDFLEGLAKLPIWFFLFLAGMALVWLSTVNIPNICEPAPPADNKDAQGKGADGKGAGGKADVAAPAAKTGEAPPAAANPAPATPAAETPAAKK
jgi:hypothetical protein